MSSDQPELFQGEPIDKTILIFTDGAGRRPDGAGSAFGFFRPDTGERQITRQDGLTNNQAEYKGIIYGLESCPCGSAVKLCSDSELAIAQLHGNYKVEDPSLRMLLRAVQEVMRRIAFVKVGRAVRFDKSDLERFIQAHRFEPRA